MGNQECVITENQQSRIANLLDVYERTRTRESEFPLGFRNTFVLRECSFPGEGVSKIRLVG